MVNWALTFLFVALFAACIGFSGIGLASAGVAKIIFVLFLAFALLTFKIHRQTQV